MPSIEEVRRLRGRLAAHPEPSREEESTAGIVRDWLQERGVDVQAGIGGHGLLARVGPTGPARLLRAELDAVPAAESLGHHCGHDGHMAMLAAALVEMADDPPRPIVGLFQPAEEDGSGMAACLQDPRLADLDIRDAYAIHNIPGEPLATAIVGPGAMASEGLRIRFKGRSSHAAEPEEGISPWPAMKAVADAICSRQEGDPRATLVHVALGQEAYGTSPGAGLVAATLRGSKDEDVKALAKAILAAVPEIEGVFVAHDEVDVFPATRNDLATQKRLAAALDEAGITHAMRDRPWPWSEDFGHAVARWGGALVGLGAGEGQAALHDAGYVFPDALLSPGIRLWHAIGGLE